MRMHEPERIREDGTTSSEHTRTDARRRGKQQSAPNNAQQRIAADRDRIQYQRPVTSSVAAE